MLHVSWQEAWVGLCEAEEWGTLSSDRTFSKSCLASSWILKTLQLQWRKHAVTQLLHESRRHTCSSCLQSPVLALVPKLLWQTSPTTYMYISNRVPYMHMAIWCVCVCVCVCIFSTSTSMSDLKLLLRSQRLNGCLLLLHRSQHSLGVSRHSVTMRFQFSCEYIRNNIIHAHTNL